ncbi:vWA domain-containing protein [Haloplanus salilacus]|uniref:vWA domain-containing protein n=1 Tax=Haloplanus salilacus TaxID=2949994 RepID=UPI0030D5A462
MSQEEGSDGGLEDVPPTVERTPTVLILDTSYSMTTETPDGQGGTESRIDQLNEGLQYFKSEIEEEEHAETRVDVAVVSFGGEVTVEQDFSPIQNWDPPTLSPSGNTPMGEAIEKAVNLDEDRKQQYRDNGYAYNRPIIWLLTDGQPTDMNPGDQQWQTAQNLLERGTDEDHFLFFAFGIGEEADMDTLDELVSVTDKDPVALDEGMFQELFEIVSNSLEKESQPGDGGDVDPGAQVDTDSDDQ